MKTAKENEDFTPENDLENDLNEVINRLEAETDEVEDDGLQAEESETEETIEATSEEESLEESAEGGEAPEPEPPVASYSAPPDWPGDVNYGELPEQAQAYIHQREVHVNQMLQNVAQERRMAQQFQQVVEPFRGLMAAEGVQDPMQAVHGLMNTTAQLAMGAPEQKAKKIADLIKHYGVDLEILDKTLAGQMPENPEAHRFEQMLNQRLGGIEQRFQQMEQQRQSAMQQHAGSAIQEFASRPENKYFNQVRTMMADVLDVATRNGQQVSLDEAYHRACLMHPEVSKQITQQNLQQNAPKVGEKRRAASSLKSGQGPNPEPAQLQDMDLREMLEKQLPGGDSRI